MKLRGEERERDHPSVKQEEKGWVGAIKGSRIDLSSIRGKKRGSAFQKKRKMHSG